MLQIIKIASLVIMSSLISAPQPNSIKTVINEINENSFAMFLSYFPKSELPYKVNLEDLALITDKQSKNAGFINRETALDMNMVINKTYLSIFQNYKFSRRGGPPIVEPIARLYIGENHVAVIFSIRPYFTPHVFSSINMITYDLKGNAVNKTELEGTLLIPTHIAGNTENETLTCSIDIDGNLESTTYKNVWEKEIKEYGFRDNRIISREVVEKNSTQIIGDNETIASFGK
jgi:hypothetical protein